VQHSQPNIAVRKHSSINGLGAFAFLDSMKKYCNIPTLNNFNGLEGNLILLLINKIYKLVKILN
jgi:hypothetical protein